LKNYPYSKPGYYFVTFATRNLKFVFGEIFEGEVLLNEYGRIALEELENLCQREDDMELDAFVIMPNHIHLILRIKRWSRSGAMRGIARTGDSLSRPISFRAKGLQAGSLGAIIGRYKSAVSRKINQLRGSQGAEIWHRNYYERIVRNEGELKRIRQYIARNPISWAQDKLNRGS